MGVVADLVGGDLGKIGVHQPLHESGAGEGTGSSTAVVIRKINEHGIAVKMGHRSASVMAPGSLTRAGTAQGGEQPRQAGRAIHDRFVGGVIAVIVVIDDEARIERRVLIGLRQVDPAQVFVDGPVDRTIE